MGNSKLEKFREPLQTLAEFPNPLVAEHARWALEQLCATPASMPS
jgi:epoxyqueuosine reductase QueG